MESLAGLCDYGSSDDDFGALSPPMKRARGAMTSPPPQQQREERAAWRLALLSESLWKLQQDTERWPSKVDILKTSFPIKLTIWID